MATHADVRRIALALPDVQEQSDHFGFAAPYKKKYKAFVWSWLERVDPKKARVRNDRVLAIRVADLDTKEALLMMDPDTFFTEPHYDGYAAVLVRLAKVSRPQLRDLLTKGHATLQSKSVPRVVRKAPLQSARVKQTK